MTHLPQPVIFELTFGVAVCSLKFLGSCKASQHEILSWLAVTVVEKALSDSLWCINCHHVHDRTFRAGSHVFDPNLCVFAVTGADGNSAGGQLAGCQHYAEDGSTLLICPLAPLQWQVCSLFTIRLYIIHIICCVFTYTCLVILLQFVPVQTPVRRRALCAGREADA